jgi:hypothetical protein
MATRASAGEKVERDTDDQAAAKTAELDCGGFESPGAGSFQRAEVLYSENDNCNDINWLRPIRNIISNRIPEVR